MVNEFAGNPPHNNAARALRLASLPQSINILQERLLEEESVMKEELPLQTTQPHQPSNPSTNRGGCRGNRSRSRGGSLRRDKSQKYLTAKFCKELDELRTLSTAGKRTRRAKTAAAAAATNSKSKLLLYSAASASFINNVPDYSTELTHPIAMKIENVISFARQSCRQTRTLSKGVKINLESLSLPGLRKLILIPGRSDCTRPDCV